MTDAAAPPALPERQQTNNAAASDGEASPRDAKGKDACRPLDLSGSTPDDRSPPAPPEPTEGRLTQLREFAREHLHGGCRILSMGDACPCNLCAVDDLAAALARQRQEIADAQHDREIWHERYKAEHAAANHARQEIAEKDAEIAHLRRENEHDLSAWSDDERALASAREQIQRLEAELGHLNRHVHECDAEDERMRAEIDRYREALRARVVVVNAVHRGLFTVNEGYRCELCGKRWAEAAPELHAPGCLAAPTGRAE